jgi:polysaccharide biosynthesis protein PslH
MNLLFITEIAPFPTNGGEKLRCYGLLKLLSGLNLNVHAIVGKSDIDCSTDHDMDVIKFYPFDFTIIKSASRITRYYRLFSRNKEFITLISSILQQNKIDVAYIDYLYYGQYIDFFRKKNIPVIYGTHNAQAVLINQRPAVSFKNRISKYIDYLVNRFHESHYFRKADALIVVSDNDKEYHADFVSREKIYVIPNFLVETEYRSLSVKKENYVLMTANFYAFQNSFGLEWFIKEVWDAELWNKTRLILLGRGSQETFSKVKEKYDAPNVTVTGEVSDLKPYISKALVSIVPLLHGSGSRLKCLESMALKTQLLSTSKGAEGIDHDNSIVMADTPGDFKNELLKLIETKSDHTEKAYQAFMNKYSLEPNKRIFEDIIRNIVKTR